MAGPHKPLFTLRGETEGVSSFKFLSTQLDQVAIAVSGTNEGTLRIWDLEERQIIHSIWNSAGPPGAVAATKSIIAAREFDSPHHILVQSSEGNVNIWDLNSTKCYASINTSTLSFAPCELLHSAAATAPSTQQLENTFPNNVEGKLSLQALQQDSLPPLLLLPLKASGSVGVFDIRVKHTPQPALSSESGRYLPKVKADTELPPVKIDCVDGRNKCGMIQAMAASPALGNYHFVAAYEAALLAVWDVRYPKQPITDYLPLKQIDPLQSVSVFRHQCWTGSAGGNIFVISLKNDGRLHLRSQLSPPHYMKIAAPPSALIRRAEGSSLPNSAIGSTVMEDDHLRGVGCMAIRSDGLLIAAGCWDNVIRLMEMKSHHFLMQLDYHTSSITCLDFSTQRGILASGSREGKIAMWNIHEQTY